MSQILVDSSVWIAFFKGEEKAKPLLVLLNRNEICTNDLILAELIPSLYQRGETTLIGLLCSIEKLRTEIDWSEIIQFQTNNLKNGVNRVGIADLIIAQNAVHNKVKLLSFDKHFNLMRGIVGLEMFEAEE